VSQFAVEVVRVGKFSKNPQSDTLMITEVAGCPVQFKEGSFKEGDLAAYIPVEAMVPLAHPEFSFLKSPNHPERTHDRIRARRLRGVFSMGFLVPAPAGAVAGQDLAKEWGVYKYEEPEEDIVVEEPPTGWRRFFKKWRWKLLKLFRVKGAQAPKQVLPVYDIESVRKYQHLLQPGEEVVLTEKIHGCNARFGWYKGKMYIGSRTMYRQEGDRTAKNYWGEMARNLGLTEKLKPHPDIALYGEVFGSGVQDLEYGAGPGQRFFRVFDVLDIPTRRYWDYDRAKDFVENTLGLTMVPELYRGPWQGLEVHAPLGEGKTTIWRSPLENKVGIREGWVVKPVVERFDNRFGRVILKYVGQGYLLRKGGTEKH
jgi:hypothetical protein